MSYIPDITERFPEGFGGVDMTPSYFGEPVDWSRAYKPQYDEEDDEDITDISPEDLREWCNSAAGIDNN